MENKANNSIFFLTLSFICIWIVLDNILGKRYLDSFLSSVFPFYNAAGLKKLNGEDITIKDFTSPTQINENVDMIIKDNVDKSATIQEKQKYFWENKDKMTKQEQFDYLSDILRSGV